MTVEQPGLDLPRPPAWRRALRWVWLLLVVVVVAGVLARRWGEVRPVLAELTPWTLVAAAAAVTAAVGASAGAWRALLVGLGFRLGAGRAARVFFVGQLGKYVPGSIWPLLVQMELGRDYGIPARVSAAALALFAWVHVVTGALVAAVTLPASGAVSGWWALLALPCVALLLPGPMGLTLRTGLRLARREPLPVLPDRRAVVVSVAWAVVMWVAFGLHVVVLVTAVGAPLPLPYAAGAFAAAFCAGFLFLPAPAGAGAREAVLVALLLPSLAPGSALAVAVVSRLLISAADAAWGAVGAASAFRRPVRH